MIIGLKFPCIIYGMKSKKPLEELTPEVKTEPPKVVKRKRSHFQNILLALIFSFGFLAILAKNIPYFSFDLPITLAIQHITVPGFRPVMIFLTTLGNVEWGIAAVIALSILLLAIGKSIYAVFFILSVSGSFLISLLFKFLISRPRPSADLITQMSHYTKNDSFPSGHVLFYVGCYGFIFYLLYTHLKAGKIKSVLLSIVGFLLLGIGPSRIYVGAHWFSDTLGAYLIGTAWLYLIIHLFTRYAKKDE